MQQITTDVLNINVLDAQNTNVPDTGFNTFLSNIINSSSAIFIICTILFITTIILFCLYKKSHKKHFIATTILLCILATATLCIPATAVIVQSSQNATNLDITLEPGATVTSTANSSLNIANIDRAYMVYVYTDDNNLYNLSQPDIMISPTLSTNLKHLESLSSNSYGVKTADSESFLPISNDPDNPTILYTSNTSTEGQTLDIVYGIKLDSDTLSGTYANSSKIKYIAEPQHQFTLTYNSSSSAEQIPSSETYGPEATFSHDFTISSETPTRQGYTFNGWCDGTVSDNTCDGVIYQSSETITLKVDPTAEIDTTTTLQAIWTPQTYTITFKSADGTAIYGTQDFVYDESTAIRAYDATSGWAIAPVAPTNKTFAGWTTTQNDSTPTYTDKQSLSTLTSNQTVYAIWETPTTSFAQAYEAAGKTKSGDYYKMQDMTTSICNAVTTATETGKEQTTILIDSRDNKLYYVSKLQDGKCWMTQNLDLDTTAAGFTNTDTDLNSQTSWAGILPNFPLEASKTAPSKSAIYNQSLSWNLGDYAYDGVYHTKCGTFGTSSYSNCTSNGFSTTNPTTTAANHYHVGNLYQYSAITAGSGSYEFSTKDTQVQDSLCPKGWRLPTGGTSGEFANLVTTYSADNTVQTLIDAPIYLVRAGQISNNNNLTMAGANGYYWTSTIFSDAKAYNFYFYSTNEIVDDYGNPKYAGQSVRCVAR